nr:TRAP transporter substrate-binding protein [Tropicimonas sp. IMCC34043]
MPLRAIPLLACLSGAATSAPAQEVVLRFQHMVSPNSAAPTYFMEPWARAVEEQSGGRIKIEIYPQMALGGKAQSLYDMIRDGAIDGGWAVPSYQPGRFPEAEALELPFMMPKRAELSSVVAWEYTQDHLLDDFADVHLITVHMHGPGIVHKKGPPVETVEDFAGLRLRGPSRPATLLLRKLGANPVGMPVPEFPEALARGILDGGVITWEMAPSLKLDELTDSHSDVSGDKAFYSLYFLWAMNKAKYESLPDDLKAVIDANSGVAMAAMAGRAYDIGDAEGYAAMVAAGGAVSVIGPEETARMQLLGDEVVVEWIDEATARGLDGAGLVEDVLVKVDDVMAE